MPSSGRRLRSSRAKSILAGFEPEATRFVARNLKTLGVELLQKLWLRESDKPIMRLLCLIRMVARINK